MSLSHEDVAKRLGEAFPRSAIKQRPVGGGRRLDYVEGFTVIRRLNEATGNHWDFRIVNIDSLPIDQEHRLVTATGELTIAGLGSRQHIGVQLINVKSGEDLIKGAVTDALKKAATLFGVGLELYGPDYESDGGPVKPVPRPTPRRVERDVPPAPVSRPTPELRTAVEPPDRINRSQMSRLHGAAAERGYDHEAVKAHAAADCGVASTKDLTAHQAAQEITWWETTPIDVVHDRMGDILGAPDKPMADAIDGPEGTPTGEIIQPAFNNRAADWEILVREASTQKALYEIGKQIKAAGIDSEELRQAYESKLRAFQAGQ